MMRVLRTTLLGVFLTSAASLAFEFLLGRLFSVTLGYHFAFIAISVAMFGLTAGAMIVFLWPRHRDRCILPFFSWLFSLSIILVLFIYLFTPAVQTKSLTGILMLIWIYILVSVPFVLGGMVICLVFEKYASQISHLYAANLCGAAAGVLGVWGLLKFVDCLSAVMGAAILAFFGSFLFSVHERQRIVKNVSLVCAGVCLILFCFNTCGHRDYAPIRLQWVKGEREKEPLYERWNTFSRITIREVDDVFLLWGPSPLMDYTSFEPDCLLMQIDGDAGTLLTRFNGDLDSVAYFKYDVTNFVHYLKEDADVFIAGVGGGRDVLSAMVFSQDKITAVDINEQMIAAVNERFGDYTGHLDKYAHVHFLTAEARSYLSRSSAVYDIIQGSLVDTWAATSAGAYALSENSLYTVEAWEIFLDHLKSNGILTFSRWYYERRPAEIYRLVSLADSSLRRVGIKDTRKHIIVINSLSRSPVGLSTILIKKTPFLPSEIDKAEQIAAHLQFDIVLSPRYAKDDNFAVLASRLKPLMVRNYVLDITAPTDDRPFFFHMMRLKHVFDEQMRNQGFNSKNLNAVYILVLFLMVAFVVCLILVLVPYFFALKGNFGFIPKKLSLAVACLGFGFMFIEISLMQRLTIFLGHPATSLSVILFTLLLSCGIGSFLTGSIPAARSRAVFSHRVVVLIGLLVLMGSFHLGLFDFLQASLFWVRTIMAVCLIFPVGLFMGMFFPLALKVIANNEKNVIPWLWGVNGAASVFASVLGTSISLFFGISWQYVLGVLFYCLSFLLFRRE